VDWRSAGNRFIARFGGEWIKAETEVKVNCPFCHLRGKSRDTSTNLEINLRDKLIYSCWRCKVSGYTSELVSSLLRGNLNAVVMQEIDEDAVAEEVMARLSAGTAAPVTAVTASPAEDLTLLRDFFPIVSDDPTSVAPREYMLGRHLTLDDLHLYRLTYSLGGWSGGRVIIPCIENNKCVFWLGRSYVGGEPPYLNVPNVQALQHRRHTVFNVDRIPPDGCAVVLEGALNAMVCGSNAVATMGKAMTDEQFWKIMAKRPAQVVVGWDKDAEAEGVAVARKFHDAGVQTYLIFFTDGRDFADLGREAARSMVEGAEPFALTHFFR